MFITGIARGAKDRLLAAAPLLMLVQMVLLPLYLWLFVGVFLLPIVLPSLRPASPSSPLPAPDPGRPGRGSRWGRWCSNGR